MIEGLPGVKVAASFQVQRIRGFLYSPYGYEDLAQESRTMFQSQRALREVYMINSSTRASSTRQWGRTLTAHHRKSVAHSLVLNLGAILRVHAGAERFAVVLDP